jgi:hypothetical protein
MKKLFVALIIALSSLQSGWAITSFLNQSIDVLNTILDSPLLQDELCQNEYIVDIHRKGTDLTSSTAFYEISTLRDLLHGEKVSLPIGHLREVPLKYIVEVLITPNVGIGPPNVVVESITPINKKIKCN